MKLKKIIYSFENNGINYEKELNQNDYREEIKDIKKSNKDKVIEEKIILIYEGIQGNLEFSLEEMKNFNELNIDLEIKYIFIK